MDGNKRNNSYWRQLKYIVCLMYLVFNWVYVYIYFNAYVIIYNNNYKYILMKEIVGQTLTYNLFERLYSVHVYKFEL